MIDPASPSQANALLRAHGLRPRKRWGQNFLCDRNAIARIVAAASVHPDDRALEIGAGLGSLTRALAVSCAFVTTVEIDPLLEPILREVLAANRSVRIITADFLKLDLSPLLDEAFGDRPGYVVANIPYYITTPIIERLLAHKRRIRRIVLLLQREFADRLVAAPGTPNYGSMSVFAQYHCRVEKVGVVGPQLFVPAPEVASAMVALMPAHPGTVSVQDESVFFRVVRAAFGQRRKTIANALAGGIRNWPRADIEAALQRAAIEPGRRGETLSLEEFARLADESRPPDDEKGPAA